MDRVVVFCMTNQDYISGNPYSAPSTARNNSCALPEVTKNENTKKVTQRTELCFSSEAPTPILDNTGCPEYHSI